MRLHQIAGYALIAGGVLYLMRQPAVQRAIASSPLVGGGNNAVLDYTFDASSVLGATATTPAPDSAASPASAASSTSAPMLDALGTARPGDGFEMVPGGTWYNARGGDD